jgi:DNA-binding XRE family transcriptional regulator
MESVEKKMRFVELRGEGKSYQKIAEELEVSKQTLINWGNEMSMEIANLRSAKIEALIEQNRVSKIARLELLCQFFEKAKEELCKRDLSSIPSDRLLMMLLRVDEVIREVEKAIKLWKKKDVLEPDFFEVVPFNG